jgi:sugar phosphate isomerase/epimerase
MQRRTFLRNTTKTGLGLGLVGSLGFLGCGTSSDAEGAEADTNTGETAAAATDLWFDISLAQWSLHKTFFAGELDNLDFAKTARENYDIGGIEYVNQFFKDKAKDTSYLGQMKQRAADHGVESVLIMVDGEGYLGDLDAAARKKAVENHYKWVDAAQFLGCHSIRVNAAGTGTAEEVAKAATEGLATLAAYGKQAGLNVIVENHGGYSSDGSWLAGVIAGTGMDNCGTLPDFGNFCIERSEDGCANMYDRYQGIAELMPFAKAVSAKSNNFKADGYERDSDYLRILKIVKDAGYTGWIGIEYEGSALSEDEGIKATKKLLEMAGRAV